MTSAPRSERTTCTAARATEREHHPDVDVAAVEGREALETLKTAYQQVDPETMFLVVSEPRRLREMH